MRKEEYYRCETCGQLYNDKMKCIECEKSHIHIEKVTEETHKPKGVASDWPTKITVTASDGKLAVYEYKYKLHL